MRTATLVLSTLFLASGALFAQDAVKPADADAAAIKATALDYAQGWYEGSGERMERALHPELAKRMVFADKEGHNRLSQMSAMTLVQATREGHGKDTPKDQQQADVTILEHFQNVAIVKTEMKGWIDYMEMAKWNGQWKIVNVLWEVKAKK
jgi:putative lumazine-binding protein